MSPEDVSNLVWLLQELLKETRMLNQKLDKLDNISFEVSGLKDTISSMNHHVKEIDSKVRY